MEELVQDLIKGFGMLIAFAFYEFWRLRKKAKDDALKKLQVDEEKKLKEKNHSPQAAVDISREVKHEERKIRDRHNAMRIFIIEFSNGVVAETGFPLYKITFDHEVVVDYPIQVERIAPNFHEIRMPEMFASPMNVTFALGEFYLKSIEDLDRTNANHNDYYNWLKTYGVMSVMWLLIRKDNKPAAILVVHWPRPTDLEGTIVARIKDIKRNIEKIYEQI